MFGNYVEQNIKRQFAKSSLVVGYDGSPASKFQRCRKIKRAIQESL